MTFGWIIGELVRRTDPNTAHWDAFIREEIRRTSGHHGSVGRDSGFRRAPHCQADRRHAADTPGVPAAAFPGLDARAQVALTPVVFERPDVRRAEIAGVGGIFNARSEARFWAMLANGGELDGVRILSQALVQTLNVPRANSDERDEVMFNIPLPISRGGFWLGGPNTPGVFAEEPARHLSSRARRLDRLGGP